MRSAALGIVLLLALLACRGGERKTSKQTASSVAPSNPCAAQRIRMSSALYVCDDVGKSSGPIALANAEGGTVHELSPSTQIVRLEADAIRRGAGHVDANICVMSGQHAGAVGYVQNTHIFGRACE
jgi:hypothetical protein